MNTLTVIEGGVPAYEPAHYTKDCPNWLLIVVNGRGAALEDYCGRYLFREEPERREAENYVAGVDWANMPNGLRVIEGQVSDTAGWKADRSRSLTTAEWTRYRNDEEIWGPEYRSAQLTDATALFMSDREVRELLESARGWLAWRRQIGEIPMGSAEVRLVQIVGDLGEWSDGKAVSG